MGDIYDYAGSGGTPSATEMLFYGGTIPFLGISDIKDRYIYNTQKTITSLGLEHSAAWIVPNGSISLAMYASVGKVGILTVDTATSQAFFNMVISDADTRDFIYSRLERAEMLAEWEPIISTGTQRNLNADKVKNWSMLIPKNSEQHKVGVFFRYIDNLITLHQRKHFYKRMQKFEEK